MLACTDTDCLNITENLVDDTSADNISQFVPCFTAGTRICTEAGEALVEELSVGDKVLTKDRGFQPIRWIGVRKLSMNAAQDNPKLRPVRIMAGALGNNLPKRDILVSRQPLLREVL